MPTCGSFCMFAAPMQHALHAVWSSASDSLVIHLSLPKCAPFSSARPDQPLHVASLVYFVARLRVTCCSRANSSATTSRRSQSATALRVHWVPILHTPLPRSCRLKLSLAMLIDHEGIAPPHRLYSMPSVRPKCLHLQATTHCCAQLVRTWYL
jgi:hypothetical protein